jgi:hypothetical protein
MKGDIKVDSEACGHCHAGLNCAGPGIARKETWHIGHDVLRHNAPCSPLLYHTCLRITAQLKEAWQQLLAIQTLYSVWCW